MAERSAVDGPYFCAKLFLQDFNEEYYCAKLT